MKLIDVDVSDASVASRRPVAPAPDYASDSSTDLYYPSSLSGGKAKLMVVSIVSGPSRRFTLRKTLAIRLQHSASGVLARHPTLPVSGHGETTGEAIDDFCEMFEAQWESLVDCSPEELTKDAFKVREELLALAQPAD